MWPPASRQHILRWKALRHTATKPASIWPTIRCNAFASTIAALKLNSGSAEAPVWVSSSAFKIGITPKIAMATSIDNVSIHLADTGSATINWGNGSEPETVALTSTETVYPHNYSGTTTHNFAIYEQNITFLECIYMGLTSLNVSGNTALTDLQCESNKFDANGLNALFGTLHSNVGTKTIYIENNPDDDSGTESCDPSIAAGKGWTADTSTHY